MIKEPHYLKDCVGKIECYLQNGFLPWRDVIFTFDNPDGSLDARQIEWILERFCV